MVHSCMQFRNNCNVRDEQKYISQMYAIDVYDKIKHLKFK